MNIMVWVWCDTELEPSVGAGMSDVDSIEEFRDSAYNLLPSMVESYYENYRDFEDLIAQAAKECEYEIKHKNAESEQDCESITTEIAKRVFGRLCVSYEIDGKFIDGDLGLDSSIFTEQLYEILLEDLMKKINRME